MNNDQNNYKKRPNLFWALILIAAGTIFLFQNLGVLSGNVWDVIILIWPLLIVLVGLNDLIRNRGIAGPAILISIGGAYFAKNLGLLDWNSWMSVLRLWPIFIIAIGLEIFIGRKNVWLSAIGVGATVSLLAAGLWFSGGVIGGNESVLRRDYPVTSENIEQIIGKAKSAQVRIDSSIGELIVGSTSNSNTLIEGRISSTEQETVYQDYEIDGTEIDYYLGSDWESRNINSFADFDEQSLTWDLSLTEEIPLDLYISLGVGESDLDLSNLQIIDLDLNIGVGQTIVELPEGEYDAYIEGGVGQTTITLPDEGQIKLDVEGGIGEMVIYIPDDMAVKIYVDRGIASLTVPSGYTQNEDVYTSPNYDEGGDYLELDLELGIGNITIREK